MTRHDLFAHLFPALAAALEQLTTSHAPALRRFGADTQATALERVAAELEAALDADVDRTGPVADVADLVGMDKTSLHQIISAGKLEVDEGDGAREVRVLDVASYRLEAKTRRRRTKPAPPQPRDRVIAREVESNE